MVFATGAFGSLLPKLAQLVHGEYKLQKSVRKNIEFLKKELEHTQVALSIVGDVPLEQLPEQVKLWARDARELSYDMEDVVDTFLVRVEGTDPPSRRSSRKFVQKMKSLLAICKRHRISKQIKDIKERVKELAERCGRYKVDIVTHGAATLDPRIAHLYVKATNLVGIDDSKKELVMKLEQQRIISIVGFGGLGKTTLAKAVYDEIKSKFDCTAFVTVSRNPDMNKFLNGLLYELGNGIVTLEVEQLIDIARRWLHGKRYLIIIDDIWNTSHWDGIKHALPDDNIGSRIITTTRNVKVADHIGHLHQMQPLSPYNSRALLCRRIFGIEDPKQWILDAELTEVSNKVLKKCAGVPLAIITIASLLAGKGRNKTEWDEVCNSIGNGMEKSLDADNMRKILSYSYYDLPSNLRTCLLYLSVFPEDFEIKKDRLIWLWIAEGFIHPKNDWKKSLFELGESYLNELVNRSMIQPIYFLHYSGQLYIRIHDMVLDLICSISDEENFITILSNTDQTSSSKVVRRLSLQSGVTNRAMTQTTQSMPLVRSVIVFPSALDQMPELRSFKVLRVLDLEDCDLSNGYSLQYLGSLCHLRYLSLKQTGIHQLPEEVGNLQYLEILNVEHNGIAQLPKCVYGLTHLLCLIVDPRMRICSRIGSLIFLEELIGLSIDDESIDNIHSLGLLTELRVLSITLRTNKCTDKIVESLCKLRKIQTLTIDGNFNGQRNFLRFDAWVAPPQLRILDTVYGCWFSAVPAWLKNSTQLQDLVVLRIVVRELQQDDIVILGRLPALYHLELKLERENLESFGRRFVVGADCFPCLVQCMLFGFLWPLTLQQGAMPRVKDLWFDFHMPKSIREIAGSDGGFDLGLGNLQSLKKVAVLMKGGANEELEKAATGVLIHLAESHPNRPRVAISRTQDKN